jgi:hypothetical protein
MTEIARIGSVEVLRLPGDRATLAGPLPELQALLDRIRRAGQLAAASTPVPDGRPGWYTVTVRLLPAQPAAAAPPAGFWTGRRVAVAAGAGAGVLTALGVLGYLALTWVAAHLAGVLAVLVLAALIAGVAMPRVCKTVVTVIHRH